MAKFKEGDIVKIPFPDGRAVLAKVLYISEYYKNLIGIGICQWIDPNANLSNIDLEPIKDKPLYTNKIAAKHYKWEVIGNRDLNEFEENATLRFSADEVLLKDQILRTATEKDKNELPEMLVIGMPLIYKWAEMILSGQKIEFGPGYLYD